MSKKMRRILAITLLVFFIAIFVSDQRMWWWMTGSHIPVMTEIHYCIAYVWGVVILFHVFWLNRKPYFSFFKRAPDLSSRGVIQIIALLLTLLLLGITVKESLYLQLEPWWEWWNTAWAAALIYHMWLNRKALFSHIGQRLTIASLALLSLTVIFLILTSAFVSTLR